MPASLALWPDGGLADKNKNGYDIGLRHTF
jgi:hypothetical protein